MSSTFEELLAEGVGVPVEGWDFSWFGGRATEERPPWGYSRLLAHRMASATAALDIQTGGGEVLAQIPHPPPVLAATESWPPNVEIARRNLAPLGATVVAVDDDADLPFPAAPLARAVAGNPSQRGGAGFRRASRRAGASRPRLSGAGPGRGRTA